MDNIVRILEEQPVWADRMRGIILGKELLALPARFYAFEKRTNLAIAELRQGQEVLRQGQKNWRTT